VLLILNETYQVRLRTTTHARWNSISDFEYLGSLQVQDADVVLFPRQQKRQRLCVEAWEEGHGLALREAVDQFALDVGLEVDDVVALVRDRGAQELVVAQVRDGPHRLELQEHVVVLVDAAVAHEAEGKHLHALVLATYEEVSF